MYDTGIAHVGQVTVDGRFVLEKHLLVGSVCDGHDIDVLEFRAGFAPITVRQNVVPADFAARFRLAALWHGPMEERVEASDADTASRRFNVFKKGRESADDFSPVERFGNFAKLIERQTGFSRASIPWRRLDFFRREFTFQREENFPFLIIKRGHVDGCHRCPSVPPCSPVRSSCAEHARRPE